MKTKFEAGKMYTTRGGQEATVYAIHQNQLRSIHGAIKQNDVWALFAWFGEGEAFNDGRARFEDLMLPKPKPKPREWTVVRMLLTDGRIVLVGEDYLKDYKTFGNHEIIKVREVIEE